MRPGGHPVAARLGADRVYAEVVVFASAEQDVGVALDNTENPSSGSAASYSRRLAARSLTRISTWSMTSLTAPESTARFDATPSGVLQ